MAGSGDNAESFVDLLAREFGARLWNVAGQYRPSRRERFQDWLMEQMSRDPLLKARLLRFMDAIVALDFDRGGGLVKRLALDYLTADCAGSSPLLRMLFSLWRQPSMPARLVSGMARSVTRTLASRFIAGEDVRSIGRVLDHLGRNSRYPTFALLGDEVLSDYEAEQFKDRYLELIDCMAVHPQSGQHTASGVPLLQISLKLTALTDNFNAGDPEGTLRRVRRRLEEIAKRCVTRNVGLTLDAEQFEYRELTWYLFRKIFGPGSSLAGWKDIGLTIQAYYRDSEDFLTSVLDFAAERQAYFQIRLAKGAYWDYEVITAHHHGWPVPVFENKDETDASFRRMLDKLINRDHNVSLAIASHNIRDHAHAESIRESRGLPQGTIEHQVLFGAAEGIARALRHEGWETRDYVPAGALVPGMPFLVRRVLELTDPAGFLRRRRAGREASELLRPPASGDRSGGGGKTESNAEGFRNSPPKRLFLASERVAFESVLEATRSQWGQEYPMKLAGQTVRTRKIKVSLSPSNPDPRNPVGLVHMAGPEEAEHAVKMARGGFARWSAMPAEERAKILTGAAERLARERDNLAAWIVHEGGRTRAEALADVDESVDHLAYNAMRLRQLQGMLGVNYRPRGVVVVISPWNFPTALPTGMLSGALAAGNTVILKSAEQTPVIATKLVETLHAAGILEDVLLHLPGVGEVVGPYLVASPSVDMVAFTGSKAVGLSIVQNASQVPIASGIKRVIAEMGGKNAIIVFPDADLDETIRGIVLSAFEHAGQKCSACSRVFVHKAVIDRVRERLVQAVKSLPVGVAENPGILVNPLIEPEAKERVLAYASKAQQEGAMLINRIDQAALGPLEVGPMFVELDPVRVPNAIVAQEEIFGPVIVLVPFEDEDEMLAQVNGTAYALTAGIFSRSPGTVARMTAAIHAGNIYVNRKITGARVAIEPFGGFKLSGTGPKAGSADYLLAFMTRAAGYRHGGESAGGSSVEDVRHVADTVQPWNISSQRRRDTLRRCIDLLRGEFRNSLAEAIDEACAVPPSEGMKRAEQLTKLVSKVVDSVSEIAEPEPTLPLPGQKNYTSWDLPRGKGFVVADDSTAPDLFATMLFGPLLAGNGIVLATGGRLRVVGTVLIDCLHRAGVPRTAILEAPGGPDMALSLANEMFHFAVANLSLEQTRQIYERLGQTREAEGQSWIKALISLPEEPQPGEPGFVRLFAIPRTIAVRTLRHGAELDIPPVDR